MTYFFSLLRFVPDPARGECVNIGAIAGDTEVADWELRVISNMKRARAIDSEGYLPTAMSFLAELQERLPGDEPDDELVSFSLDDLHELSATMNNVVELTSPNPIVASDAQEALDTLWRDLLLDPEGSEGHRYKNARSAVGATNRAYREAELPPESVARKVELASGRFTGEFDFAVHNGEAVQVVKCFSFQRPNQVDLAQAVTSWAWLVHELRDHGGTVKPRAGEVVSAPKDLSVASVYVPPADGQDTTAFEQATDIFGEVDVEARPWTDAGPVARVAFDRLQVH
jgi:hypothetical protein